MEASGSGLCTLRFTNIDDVTASSWRLEGFTNSSEVAASIALFRMAMTTNFTPSVKSPRCVSRTEQCVLHAIHERCSLFDDVTIMWQLEVVIIKANEPRFIIKWETPYNDNVFQLPNDCDIIKMTAPFMDGVRESLLSAAHTRLGGLRDDVRSVVSAILNKAMKASILEEFANPSTLRMLAIKSSMFVSPRT